jgi:hypothetical protein
MTQGMRALAASEIALLKEAFGDRVTYPGVRLRLGHGGNPAAMIAFKNKNTAITLVRSIYFRTQYGDDFAQGDAAGKALLHHEMVHIWQYATLGVIGFLARYARDLASVGFRPGRLYDYEKGKTPFAEARLEAQAQMVEDYWLALAAGKPGPIADIARNLKGSGFYGL